MHFNIRACPLQLTVLNTIAYSGYTLRERERECDQSQENTYLRVQREHLFASAINRKRNLICTRVSTCDRTRYLTRSDACAGVKSKKMPKCSKVTCKLSIYRKKALPKCRWFCKSCLHENSTTSLSNTRFILSII